MSSQLLHTEQQLSDSTMGVENARKPLTEFHLFPNLSTELRLEIWEFAGSSIPLQVHLSRPLPLNARDVEPYPGMRIFKRSLEYHDQRMKKILPLLHTNYESRKATLDRYSLVPIYDLIVDRDSIWELHPEVRAQLDFGLYQRRVACDWRGDTLFWPDYWFPLPPGLCAGICSATKLCIVVQRYYGADEDHIEDMQALITPLIEEWTQNTLPKLPKLKEITFTFTGQVEIFTEEQEAGRDHHYEIPYRPCPEISILGSLLTGGPVIMNKSPLSPFAEQPSHWWEPVLYLVAYTVRTLQKGIQRQRSEIKLHWAFDWGLIDTWEDDWESRSILLDDEERDWELLGLAAEGKIVLQADKLLQFVKLLELVKFTWYDEDLTDEFSGRCIEICERIREIIKAH
ncbi:hypothetical protein F5B22DRAFT_661713 [Xylaria bambusicola]|uniref:uncharacterized protein n=1 Tax=Xylaria bambusicola TaxID=326684 RepID=UPI002008D7BB|nr:uncharacterized protein F5B22DRAFT_661713 [Xylaria bambusicola]KAI0505292.1 hypothetical protein F5B22DRAFT_661713 [Xylaria bambusicola]